MSSRTRKLVGSLGVIVFLGAYIWLVSLAAPHVPRNPWIQLAFFAVAGIAWGFPLFPLITWMQRGSR